MNERMDEQVENVYIECERCSERETESIDAIASSPYYICSQRLLTTQTDGGSWEGRRIDVNENRTSVRQ